MDKNQDQFVEQLLEAALVRYGSTEPPLGLARRIMAKLSERRSAQRRWWLWSPALAMVSTMVIAAAVLHLDGVMEPVLLQPAVLKTALYAAKAAQPVESGVKTSLAELGSTPAVAVEEQLATVEEQTSLELVSGIAPLEVNSVAEESGIPSLRIQSLVISELAITTFADPPVEPTDEETT